MHKSSFKTMDSTMEAHHNANCTDIGKYTILTHHWLQERYYFIPLHQYLHENKGQFKFLQSSNLMHHWLQIRYHFIPFHLKRESHRAFWKNRKFLYNSYQRILIVDKMCWNVSFWIPPVMELSSLWHLALTKQA